MKHVVASIGQTSNAPAREKPNVPKLQVFFLPMTHVDPGWLKTFDEYCPSTNAILDNMHQFLKEHPKMRFMWCEISFFEVWWSKVNETVKSDIKKMISNGQLEIASGSWVMSDEANPYFGSSVDNIIEGQQFVLNELGVKPTVIWSNDPFGYGPTIPYLFKKTGIRRAVINRIHHKIKQYLQSKRAIPFIWKQHFDSSNKSDVLTQVLPYTHYDILNSCGPARSVCCQFDFKRMTHFSCPGSKPVPITNENKAAKAALLKQQLVTMSKLYESNVLLVVWGDDFRYDMLQEWYQHYDNLMPLFEQLNTENDIEVRFGTFNDYFNALEKFYASKSLKPATVSGDFFPYQCALGDYWTGYYTTRPFFKKLERQLHAMIYAADLMMLSSAPVLSDSVRLGNQKLLITSRRNLALFQHHDAITGTSKKHVMQDYATRLHSSMVAVNEVFEKTLNLVFNSSFQMLVFSDVEDEFLNVDLRIDIRQFCDLQLVTTFNTSLDPLTTQAFTDSNGMQLIKREYHSTLDAAANYYPMPTVFMLQDQNTRLSIVSNLEHGARVYGSTGAEIMLDRVMCRDDGKGLGSDTDSIPNDILPVAMEFTIVVESMANSTLVSTLQNLKQSSLSLPFDVQIVSSRSLPQNANRQLLVLHRLGTDCSSAKKLNSSALSLEVC
uniref:mannosyl-oligosaccharide 1,3-1,6-alpha-mannosidase n=1 Tax=Syphacia muris TaxID=451379 RepID=A0A0N5A8W6_9BILA